MFFKAYDLIRYSAERAWYNPLKYIDPARLGIEGACIVEGVADIYLGQLIADGLVIDGEVYALTSDSDLQQRIEYGINRDRNTEHAVKQNCGCKE